MDQLEERDAASDAAILEDAVEVLRLRFGKLTAGDLIDGLTGTAASIRATRGRRLFVKQLDDLTPAAIKAAIPAVFPGDGHAEVHHVLWYVAEKLGSGSKAVPQGYSGTRVQERYLGRVKRAMDALAEEGVLVRVGAKDRPPDGTSPGTVSYWTPEAYQEAKSESEKRRREGQAQAFRNDRIHSRLRAAGIAVLPDGSLRPDDWEHLLDLAGL